jgi:hypothetical protein
MANVLFDRAKFKMMAPGTLGTTSGDAIDLASDTIDVVLVTAGYTFSSSDEFLDPAIVAGNRVGTPTALASLTVSNAGVFDASDIVFSAVSGSQVTQIVMFKDTGTETTSPLIAYWDTMTGLPITPNGGDITVTWNAAGIFNL